MVETKPEGEPAIDPAELKLHAMLDHYFDKKRKERELAIAKEAESQPQGKPEEKPKDEDEEGFISELIGL